MNTEMIKKKHLIKLLLHYRYQVNEVNLVIESFMADRGPYQNFSPNLLISKSTVNKLSSCSVAILGIRSTS